MCWQSVRDDRWYQEAEFILKDRMYTRRREVYEEAVESAQIIVRGSLKRINM